jgi:glutaredoxin
MPKVTIYTTASCAYCHAEKEFLKANGVAFEEKAVDTDPALAEEMIQMSGQLGVPFTVIQMDEKEDSKIGILGFDQHRLSEVLGL